MEKNVIKKFLSHDNPPLSTEGFFIFMWYLLDMKYLIRKVLREYVEDFIQEVDFNGFSEPVLIPQYNKYLVKFNGTGKVEKIPDSEVIIFRDKSTGKEYQFNSNDVQKSGLSPFYIGLDVLRKYYDIKFDDKFVKHKVTLSKHDYSVKLREVVGIYGSDGRCKNSKCEQLRNVIEECLKEMYGENYGEYSSEICEPTQGFLNVFPLNGTDDDNGNKWSKLNYVIYQRNSISSLIMAYLKQFGTFEHRDFIEWVKDSKERLFSGPFFDLMLRNIIYPRVSSSGINDRVLAQIKKLFPNATPVQKFCPSTRREYNELVIIDNDGEIITFQPVDTKSSKVLKKDGKYYIFFSRRVKSPNISKSADYIVSSKGPIFKNRKVIFGNRTLEFDDPPVYYELPYMTELGKYQKLK